MHAKLFKNILFFFSFIFLLQNPITASIASGTLVKTSQGLVTVESLKIGDKVEMPNFDKSVLDSKLLTEIEVVNISATTKDKIVVVKTDKGDLQVSPDHFFYDDNSKGFIKAQDLSKDSMFTVLNIECKEFGLCNCLAIEYLEKPTVLYDVTLRFPHIFFISGAQILTHNCDPITIGVGIETIALVGAAVVAGCAGE